MQLAYAVPASTLQEEMTTTSKKWRLQGHRKGRHRCKQLQTDSGAIQKACAEPKMGARQRRRPGRCCGLARRWHMRPSAARSKQHTYATQA